MAGYYRIRNLKKDYNPQEVMQPAAINIAQLDIELGGIIAIVGGSGSGKTTFLNLISGLEDFDRDSKLNTVLDLQLPGDSDLIQLSQSFPHDRVSYIFQQGYLLSQASIGINLAMTRRAAGLRADAKSLDNLLSMAQLHDSDDKSNLARKSLKDRALTLSGGQQQRINIARALGREPVLLFADELSSSLDPHKAHLVLTELRNWLWQGQNHNTGSRINLQRTMLWVTHDYELACDYADAIIVLHEGRVAEHCERPIECNTNQPSICSTDLLDWVHTGRVPQRYAQSDSKPEIESPPLQSSAADHDGSNAKSQQLSPLESVLGNIGSGIALSWLEAYPLPRPSGSAIVRVVRQVCRPLFGFSHWVRALQLAAVLSLIMIITYGRNEVIEYFDSQLNDPSLRHVIVQQNTKELQRSVIDDDSLESLSMSIGDLSGPKAHAEKSAFGRFTESVDVYPEGIDLINPGYIAEITIGILDRDEPAYKALEVVPLDEASPGCNSDVTIMPGELIPYADELTLIVSQSYIQEVKNIYDTDLCANPFLDLWDAGTPRTFRVVGYVPNPPADGYDHFDAMMQIGVWRNWVSLVGKSQIESFSRAAVYFTQSNHKGVIAELYARAFAFDREIISKFERLIGTAAKLRNTFLVISWLTLAVAATVAAGLIWSYLAQNSKSIAVLRAHAAWVWPLAAAIPFQLLLTFSYSVAYIAITISLWNWLVDHSGLAMQVANMTGGTWLPSRLTWPMIETTLPWVLGSLVVMLLVGWVCLFVWRVTHHRLAHELRQAY